MKLHSCAPTVYYNNQQAYLVSYLIEHHRAAIIDNQHITPTQIRFTKRILFSNNINYKQAYYTIQSVLTKMYSDKAESFTKFLAYTERFKAADLINFYKIAKHKDTN